MPRKNTAEYREYMKCYMKNKRLGLTGINSGINIPRTRFESKQMVGGNGLEPMTSAML